MREVLISEEDYKLIKELMERGGEELLANLAKSLGVEESSLMRRIAELSSKGLVEERRTREKFVELTEEGMNYLEEGLPEERLYGVVLKLGRPCSIEELRERALEEGLSEKEFRIGLMHLLRVGVCKLSEGIVSVDLEKDRAFRERSGRLRHFLKAIRDERLTEEEVRSRGYDQELKEARRRKLVVMKERTIVHLVVTSKTKELLARNLLRPARLVTKLSPDLIRSGKWRSVIFKPFDLTTEVPVIYPGRKHPYMEFLDQIREILVSLGFEEMKGPHVELEFWNFDVLFQAQDHPAREIHDTFYLKYPTMGEVSDKELFERVRLTHENGWQTGSKGWRYRWDPRRALRLIMRTQTTSVSVRTLRLRGNQVFKAFALDRNFRPEALDATHSMEFYQCEGIVVGPRLNFRHLLGFLKEFTRRLGLEKVKFKPAYFPFTEPSVEGFVYHRRLGWIEALPGGMFRPEVLEPLGIKYRVLAWGIGIDRLAMIVLGIDDIRDLFSKDLSFLRSKSSTLLPSLMR